MKAMSYLPSLLVLCLLSGFTMSSATADGEEVEPESQVVTSPSAPLGTDFTYQGELQDAGGPVSGTCDLLFKLWTQAIGGSQLGTNELSGVTITDGLFSANLDFGASVFQGDARWLEVSVSCPAGSGSYALLTPRQALTPAPYALYAMDASNDHSHFGQAWSGSIRGLSIGSTDSDALELTTNGNGISIPSANIGVNISSVASNGVAVYDAGTNAYYVNSATNGLMISQANNDGVHIIQAGVPSTNVISSGNNGFEVEGAEGNGLYVGRADNHGIHVDSAGNDGVRVDDAYQDGVQIGDGFDFPLYGLYIPPPGVPYTALWPNTSHVSGEWALYTPDKISAANVTTSTLTLVAQVESHGNLTAGDLVTVVGMADPLPNTLSTVPLVDRTNGSSFTGVIGIVGSRMAFQQAVNKEEGALMLQSIPGSARNGDYVSLVVFGITEVKVDPQANGINPGQRLTVSEVAGHTRGLRSEMLNGMVVTEGTPVIGIALAAPVPGETTIPVFVTLR